VIFDTDVIIWALRGNRRAAEAIDLADELALSVISYMELIKGARDKADLRATQDFIRVFAFAILPVSEDISHRARVYVEEYALKSNLGIPDALIAATAVERGLHLCTGNAKDYRAISELQLKVFRSS
jgi:predicted nucleic acid-binding protein